MIMCVWHVNIKQKMNTASKLKNIMSGAAFAFFAFFSAFIAPDALSQTASVEFVLKGGECVSRQYGLEKMPDGTLRLRVPKSEIAPQTDYAEVSADFASAAKGEDGYLVFPRGEIVEYDVPDGKVSVGKFIMPLFGMKTPRSVFWAHLKTLRHEAEAYVSVSGGKCVPVIRYCISQTGFGAYDDIVVEYKFLPLDAGYVDIGKAYRKYQLDRGVVKPIKDRIRENPWLGYVAKSIPVRIQYHGSKKRQDKDFTPETEPPLIPVLDFRESVKFVDAFKKSGIDDVTFCSAGWQSGGYDGRFPDLFPVPEELGGEAALREFISHVKSLGYMIHAHTNTSDCYMCSRMWDNASIVAKNPDGSLQRGHYWGGGRAYKLCAKNARDKFLFKQLEKVRDLGFQAPHYIDVFSAIPPYMCADPKHPGTREEMAEVQRDIAEYCKKLFGGFSSECGFDHLAGQLDYINYVSSRMQQWRKAKLGKAKKGTFFEKMSRYVDRYVPLWEIVYHGIILSNPDRLTQNHTAGQSKSTSSGDLSFNQRDGIQDPYATLKLAEFGGRPIFYTSSFKDIKYIKKAYDEFLPLRHLQLEFIEDHKYIAPDVTLTLFGNGEKIVCNYGASDFVYEGKTVKPMSYILAK